MDDGAGVRADRPGRALDDAVEGCAAAHQRLLADLESLEDAEVGRPSLLPGWTIGHVLTHLARNADSQRHVLEAAVRGEAAERYPGGREQRTGDIEAGAGRPAAALVEDVRRTIWRLEAAWPAVPAEGWELVGTSLGRPEPVAELPFYRWREVEVHHADLGRPSFGYDDWSAGAALGVAARPAIRRGTGAGGRMAVDPAPRPTPSGAAAVDFDALDLAWLQAKPGAKWQRHGPGRLAAWVADMDFPTPPPIVAALHRFIDAGDLGYPDWLDGSPLRALFTERMTARFGWSPDPAHVREVCDVVQGIQWVLHLATPVDSLVALHVPAYPPFLDTSSAMARPVLPIPAERTASGWAFDHDRFAADLAAAAGRCRALLLCNPHNPTGHVFTGPELERLAALAEEHDLAVISDEIHADLVYPPATHRSIAALDPAIAARTVTLTSATKAFNIAGVRCAVAHLGSEAVRRAWEAQPQRLFGVVSPLGVEATRAAWEDGGDWLDALVVHLDRNRRLLGSLLAGQLPDVGYVPPEATYLAWLDLRTLQLADPPHTVLRDGGAVLYPGPDFGPQGEGFVRLNFATSAAVLEALVARMASAVAGAPRRAQAATG